MFSVMKRFHLLMHADCEYQLMHINGILTNLHQQLSRVWKVFTCDQ